MVYRISDKAREFCTDHARRMCAGAKTRSFKNETEQSEDVYFIGKVGEWGMWRYLKEFERVGLVQIIHTPFREDYAKFNWNDDFIIEDAVGRQQIEVRTKARSVDPEPHFECCTDCIKPNLVYVFASYNKVAESVSLVGVARWPEFQAGATVALRGDINSNFSHKVNEFNIQIRNLSKMESLIRGQ